MKKIIIATALLIGTQMTIFAQNEEHVTKPVRNVSIELLGASNGIGLVYDSRFKSNDGWGYSIGAGWGSSKANDIFGNIENYQNVSISPRINYLLGKKNSKLELGLGLNLGYQFGSLEYNTYKQTNEVDGALYYEIDQHVKENKQMFTYFFFGNIGYRRQSTHGFVFRAGLSPTFGLVGSHTVDKFYLVPYLGFGKSF